MFSPSVLVLAGSASACRERVSLPRARPIAEGVSDCRERADCAGNRCALGNCGCSRVGVPPRGLDSDWSPKPYVFGEKASICRDRPGHARIGGDLGEGVCFRAGRAGRAGRAARVGWSARACGGRGGCAGSGAADECVRGRGRGGGRGRGRADEAAGAGWCGRAPQGRRQAGAGAAASVGSQAQGRRCWISGQNASAQTS